MTTRAKLVLAAALLASVASFNTTTASAAPALPIAPAIATDHDGAHIDNVRVFCNWRGCFHTYGYRGWGYRHWAYGYRPYGYRWFY
jgi:hypothetical protein